MVFTRIPKKAIFGVTVVVACYLVYLSRLGQDFEEIELVDNLKKNRTELANETSKHIKSTGDQISPQFPVLVVGLPKTGTKSIHVFFEKAGYRSSHWKCGEELCAFCIRDSIQRGDPPLSSCGNYDVYTQMDAEDPGGKCHFPQITDLEYIHQEAPNATLILTTRNLTNWARSTANWIGKVGIPMSECLAQCKDGPKSSSSHDLIQWHLAANENVREFAKRHPSHLLLEIDIENPNAGDQLARLFQTEAEFWTHTHESKVSKFSLLSQQHEETP